MSGKSPRIPKGDLAWNRLLTSTATSCRCRRPRSPCSTAAFCLPTASTRSPPCSDGKLIDNASHLARLERSVGEIELALPESLAAHRGNPEGTGQAQQPRQRHGLSGGDARRRHRPRFRLPEGDVKPTLIMFTSVKDIVNAPSAKTGIGVITVPDIRWTRRDIKSVALLAQVLAKQAAAEAGAGEAWMIEDGKVTEGGSSSCFILTQDDVIVTRQNGSEILPGCTRKAVVKLAEERQLRVEERAFTVEEALGRQGSLHHQRHRVRAGGGFHRRQEGRRRQARPDDQPAARDLCGFRQGDGGLRWPGCLTSRRREDRRRLAAPRIWMRSCSNWRPGLLTRFATGVPQSPCGGASGLVCAYAIMSVQPDWAGINVFTQLCHAVGNDDCRRGDSACLARRRSSSARRRAQNWPSKNCHASTISSMPRSRPEKSPAPSF